MLNNILICICYTLLKLLKTNLSFFYLDEKAFIFIQTNMSLVIFHLYLDTFELRYIYLRLDKKCLSNPNCTGNVKL